MRGHFGLDPLKLSREDLERIVLMVLAVVLTEAVDDASSLERRELNRTVWRTIKRWQRSPKTRPYFDDRACGEERLHHPSGTDGAWTEILAASRRCLSDRQQRILELTRDGWRVNEIADSLQITPARVSDEKYKAISNLRDRMLETA